MLGTALYYPSMDIDDTVWLKSAILFWDDIRTIVPSSIESPYRNEETRICSQEGYLSPFLCDQHPEFAEELGKKIMQLADPNGCVTRAMNNVPDAYDNAALDKTTELSNILSRGARRWHDGGRPPFREPDEILNRISRGKLPQEVANLLQDLSLTRMHPEKLPYLLKQKPRQYTDDDGEWFLVSREFADTYLAALASKLARSFDLSPLTSRSMMHGLNFQFLFDDQVDGGPNQAAGALIDVVFQGLKVDPTTPIEKLIKFRRKRAHQFAELGIEFQEFKDILSNAAQDNDIRDRAQKLYQSRIAPKMSAVRREAEIDSINTAWDGALRALTVSVPTSGALSVLTDIGTQFALGAGAALAVVDLGIKSYLSAQRLRVNNPYSYLHDLTKNYGLPMRFD